MIVIELLWKLSGRERFNAILDVSEREVDRICRASKFKCEKCPLGFYYKTKLGDIRLTCCKIPTVRHVYRLIEDGGYFVKK